MRKDDVGSDQAAGGPHAAEIRFAIHVFEQEAKTGTNYPVDCCKVLQDLKALTDGYVLAQSIPSRQPSSADGRVDISTSQPATAPSEQLQGVHGWKDDPQVYQKLKDWAQDDGLSLQDTLLI
jgi:hypothetical protein